MRRPGSNLRPSHDIDYTEYMLHICSQFIYLFFFQEFIPYFILYICAEGQILIYIGG